MHAASAHRLAPLKPAPAPRRAERRGAPTMRVRASASRPEADDRATMSRRDLGVASIALGGVLRDLAGASPAEAKKIVSGYVPARGVDVRAR